MAVFRIKIAGHVAEVKSVFDSTRDYCRRYLTEEAPEFMVEVSRKDMDREQQLAYEEALEEGFRPRVFTDPFLDRAVIQRKIAEELLNCGVLLFHGSAVAVDGAGYLFTAKSGTGKSTHTRFWMEAFGDRAVMVNDDKPFLRITDTGVLLCGAPWSGKHGLDANISVPLKGICILERGQENQIRQISSEEALPRLCHEACPSLEDNREAVFLELVNRLAERCPLWKMHCTRNIQAAKVAYEAMSNV